MTQSTLLHVRPASDPDLGRSVDIGMTIVEEAFSSTDVQLFRIEFLSEVLVDLEDLADLAETMMENVAADGVLFIDADFQRAAPRSYQILDSFLGTLLRQPAIFNSAARIYLTMEALPRRVDQIFELTTEPALQERFLIIDGHHNRIGPEAMARRVEPVLDRHLADSNPTDGYLLRRRGVFRRPEPQETFYPFYFDPLTDAVDTFQRQLVDFMIDQRTEFLVFDSSTSGPWFPSLVRAACLDLKTKKRIDVGSVDVSDLIGGGNGDQRKIRPESLAHARAIITSGARLAIVVPAFASGRTLGRALTAVDRPQAEGCHLLAVLADQEGVGRGRREGDTLEWTHGRKKHAVKYFHAVPMPSLASSDWLVRAGLSFGEVRDFPLDDRHDPLLSRVAAWSIIAECGVGLETIAPGGRARVKYYPALQRLSAWDAHLLGELAIERVLDMDSGSSRATMLMVVPDEENGSRPIATALRKRCRVAVSRIPRAVIDGEAAMDESDRAKILRHRSNTIVIFDEATVTGGTLKRLQAIVEQVVGYSIPLLGCVFDLSGRSASAEVFSLSCWKAVARGGQT